MTKRIPYKYWSGLVILFALCLLVLAGKVNGRQATALASDNTPDIQGPFVGEPVLPYVFNGDLRDLPQIGDAEPRVPIPLRYLPGQEPKGSAPQLANWVDPVAQTIPGAGQMPDPIANFAGLDFVTFGAGWPPDTNGDVGPNHYIQTVNTSIGIYDKTTGTRLVGLTLDSFFTGPPGSSCDNNNQGDPVALYDPMADRWIVTNFAWFNFNTGPFYECIAVSQGPNPVTDGWYFYELRADTGGFTGYLNDYPKLGVWPDGWYMTANMFQQVAPGTGFGVRVWALDRASMLVGGALNEVHFDLCNSGECGALLPSNLRGPLPPADSPNYMITMTPPNLIQLWELHVDWIIPGNSTFTGPVNIPIAEFAPAQSIPQPGTGTLLDSLSFRPMMQLQYRNRNGVESLWMNHSVAATDGIGGVRWYEVQDPGGTPTLVQQGTFQPDQHHRWMGSLAVDQDGNMAVGYSVGSSTLFPGIRYAGRQDGEVPGMLPQNEAVLINGTGSQVGINRWGDYSAMTVDPVDDCTFWYTTEYLIASGTNWQTRIGSFRFPSCGQPKGYLEGIVRNSVTLEPVAGAIVTAEFPTQTLSAQTDVSGYYTMTLLAGTYEVTAEPLLPGYPISDTVGGVVVSVGNTAVADLYLSPVPYLVEAAVQIDDNVTVGNNNGYPEPGEQGILLFEGLQNIGAITATNVTANLVSLTPGVTIDVADADYPNIAAADTMTNTTPFVFSVASSVTCGDDLDFQKTITSTEGSFIVDFSLNAAVPLPREDIFNNDVEGGAAGWTTGGTPNTWAITTVDSHSPTHSWTDSPAGNYGNNANNYVRTPAFNLTGQRKTVLTGWFKWSLEAGYDYAYIDYSLNGGTTWSNDASALYVFNADQDWTQITVETPMLDNQPNVALRFRVVTDGSVVFDGIYVDDVALSYEPFECQEVPAAPSSPTLLSPPDNSTDDDGEVTFVWADSGTGDEPTGYVFTLDGSPITFTASVTTTTMTLTSGSHTWNVTAFNDVGYSAPSATWTVNVPEAPSSPTLVSPPDNSTDGDGVVTFVWADSGTGGEPTGYIFTLDGTAVMTFTSPITTTTLTLTVGSHTWSVVAYNGIGVSTPSDTWTVDVPAAGYFIYLPVVIKP